MHIFASELSSSKRVAVSTRRAKRVAPLGAQGDAPCPVQEGRAHAATSAARAWSACGCGREDTLAGELTPHSELTTAFRKRRLRTSLLLSS